MNLAREIERRLERLVDGISSTIFRGRVHPVDLATGLIREADLRIHEAPAGPTIPNVFEVVLARTDLDEEIDAAALRRELERAVESTAIDRGWRFEGPVRVELDITETSRTGSMVRRATVVPGRLAPWAWLLGADGRRAFELCKVRELVGRDTACDVRLEEGEVSRRHAVIFREAAGTWIRDLGSVNGSAHNGQRLGDDAVDLSPGDIVSFGPVVLTFRPT